MVTTGTGQNFTFPELPSEQETRQLTTCTFHIQKIHIHTNLYLHAKSEYHLA
jgi:hypothetical protein